jgi:hypothetical protein
MATLVSCTSSAPRTPTAFPRKGVSVPKRKKETMLTTKNIFRKGNKFYVEGRQHEIATVNGYVVRNGSDETNIEFTVNYTSTGADTPSEVLSFARAIESACYYADLCAMLFKGKTVHEIRDIWEKEKNDGA